jgi:hypothetical protein
MSGDQILPLNYQKPTINPDVLSNLQAQLTDCPELDRVVEFYDTIPPAIRTGFEYDVSLICYNPSDTNQKQVHEHDKAVALWQLTESIFNNHNQHFNQEGKIMAFKRDYPHLYEMEQLKAEKAIRSGKRGIARLKFASNTLFALTLGYSLFTFTSPIWGRFDDTVFINYDSSYDETYPVFFKDFQMIGYGKSGVEITTSQTTQFKYIVIEKTIPGAPDKLYSRIYTEDFKEILGGRSAKVEMGDLESKIVIQVRIIRVER